MVIVMLEREKEKCVGVVGCFVFWGGGGGGSDPIEFRLVL